MSVIKIVTVAHNFVERAVDFLISNTLPGNDPQKVCKGGDCGGQSCILTASSRTIFGRLTRKVTSRDQVLQLQFYGFLFIFSICFVFSLEMTEIYYVINHGFKVMILNLCDTSSRLNRTAATSPCKEPNKRGYRCRNKKRGKKILEVGLIDYIE